MKLKRTALDALFSLVVRMRDKWTCQICHKTFGGYPAPGLEAAHCYSRGHYTTRFELDNAMAVCTWCHKFSDKSLHNMGQKYTERIFKKRLGEKKFKELKWKHDNPSKFPKIDKDEIKKFLLSEKERLEKETDGLILGARS